MASSIVFIISAVTILGTSIAIKCVTQPVPEEFMKFRLDRSLEIHAPEDYPTPDLAKIKAEFLRLMKTRGEMDCALKVPSADNHMNPKEPTHCLAFDFGSCPEYVKLFVNDFGHAPEEMFVRGCITDGEAMFLPGPVGAPEVKNAKSIEKALWIGEDAGDSRKMNAEKACAIIGEIYKGCTGCYVCNDGDLCNAANPNGPGKPGPSNGAGNVPGKTGPSSGALSTMGESVSALLLLLLAIAFGAFR